MKLIYSPWGNGDDIYPFDKLFSEKANGKAQGFEGASAFILWGGTDIHPSYYGAKHNVFSFAPAAPSERDVWEYKAMKYCKANNIPIIGICRGAQFLCAFAGGYLVQHMKGHDRDHMVHDEDGEVYPVKSSHHQMMVPFNTEHRLVAWSSKQLSHFYYGEASETPLTVQRAIDDGTFQEPETVFFPSIRGLGIQGHPEWADPQSKFVDKCLEHVETYLLGNVQ